MGRNLVQNLAKTQVLEEFWQARKLPSEEDSQQGAAESPSDGQAERRQSSTPVNGRTRTRHRAVSTASALAPPGQSLSPHHPALSLPALLDTFGPLIFPVYKAALLRKRILLVGQAPVELACNFGRYKAQNYLCRLTQASQCTTSLCFPAFRQGSPNASHSNLYPLACGRSSQ